MPGGQRGQLQAAEFDRLAILHLQHAMPRPKPMSIKTGRARRGQGQFVPGDVIGVRVRNETARLTTADIDAHLGLSQK